jgi:hypothetical protein
VDHPENTPYAHVYVKRWNGKEWQLLAENLRARTEYDSIVNEVHLAVTPQGELILAWQEQYNPKPETLTTPTRKEVWVYRYEETP